MQRLLHNRWGWLGIALFCLFPVLGVHADDVYRLSDDDTSETRKRAPVSSRVVPTGYQDFDDDPGPLPVPPPDLEEPAQRDPPPRAPAELVPPAPPTDPFRDDPEDGTVPQAPDGDAVDSARQQLQRAAEEANSQPPGRLMPLEDDWSSGCDCAGCDSGSGCEAGDSGCDFGCDSGCDLCGAGCDGACLTSTFNSCRPASWLQVDYMLLWTKADQVPALVTSSPVNTPRVQAGVLGQPGTSVLFGNESPDTTDHHGVRVAAGAWLNDRTAITGHWFSLSDGDNRGDFYVGGTGAPILARPYFNTQQGMQDSQLISFPGVATGTIRVHSSSQMHSGGALVRRSYWEGCGGRIDLLGGYRYFHFRDRLAIDEELNSIDPRGPARVGTAFSLREEFLTRNNFHGGELGIAAVWQRDCWQLDMTATVALGGVHEQVVVRGTTVQTPPGGQPLTRQGGLLALPSNLGTQSDSQFGVLPELDVRWRYRLTTQLNFSLGYHLLLLNRVVRPGDQIDLTVNPTQLSAGQLVGPGRPARRFDPSSLWAQGMTAGIEWTW